jgi:hypothetical protein
VASLSGHLRSDMPRRSAFLAASRRCSDECRENDGKSVEVSGTLMEVGQFW